MRGRIMFMLCVTFFLSVDGTKKETSRGKRRKQGKKSRVHGLLFLPCLSVSSCFQSLMKERRKIGENPGFGYGWIDEERQRETSRLMQKKTKLKRTGNRKTGLARDSTAEMFLQETESRDLEEKPSVTGQKMSYRVFPPGMISIQCKCFL